MSFLKDNLIKQQQNIKKRANNARNQVKRRIIDNKFTIEQKVSLYDVTSNLHIYATENIKKLIGG